MSLRALADLALLVLALLGCGLGLLLVLMLADAIWKLGELPALQGGTAPFWVEQLLSLAVLALPLAWVIRQPAPLDAGKFPTRGAAWTIAVAAGVLAAAVSYPIQWLAQATGNELLPSNLDWVEQMLGESWVAAVLVLVVIAPITEELVFRRFLLARFLKQPIPHWES